jgi:hypothetical protein
MSFQWYEKHGGGLELSSTLRALMTEDGAHMFKLAFEKDVEDRPRNPIFGVALVRQALVDAGDKDGWSTYDEAARCDRDCVFLCYELCEAFPLCENGEAFNRLQQTIERILAVRVRLLPFTRFQRSASLYPALLPIFQDAAFVGLFRDDAGSLLDLRMNVVLSRWQCAPFTCRPAPTGWEDVAPSDGLPQDEWNTCFSSIAQVLWYHAYVFDVIGEDTGSGMREHRDANNRLPLREGDPGKARQTRAARHSQVRVPLQLPRRVACFVFMFFFFCVFLFFSCVFCAFHACVVRRGGRQA